MKKMMAKKLLLNTQKIHDADYNVTGRDGRLVAYTWSKTTTLIKSRFSQILGM